VLKLPQPPEVTSLGRLKPFCLTEAELDIVPAIRNPKGGVLGFSIVPGYRPYVITKAAKDPQFVWDNFIEKHYPYPERLTALGIDTPKDVKSKYPKMDFIKYNGSVFPFKDKAFDICWSNAVIEHVGGLDKQLFFLKEIKRVSKKAFITTPNKLFPVELHTRTPLLHYLPKSMFDGYLGLIGKKWATDAYMNLLSISDLKHLLKKADINNYTIARNRLCGLTLDFVILIG